LQSFSIKEDEIKKKKKPVDPVSENYEDDTELQRALDESYQHISPPLSIPTYPSQNIEESLDKDIATALLMSMEELEFTEPQTYENLPLPVQAPQVPPELEPESEPVPQLMDDSVIDISEAIEESKMEEEKRQLNERRLHVREQDDAYETSMAIDRSKEDYLKEIERNEKKQKEELMRLEKMKAQEKDERERYLKALELSLPMEPDASDPNALHLTFRLPNGDRFSRFFLKSSTLKQVKNFVDSQELQGKSIPLSYNLITDFPKQIWNNLALHLSETNFQKRQLLRIELSEN